VRFRLTVAAVAAASACVLSLGVAGAMAAAGGNGSNSGGGSQAIATPGAGSQSTATSGPGNSSQGCDGTHHSDTGHGANQGGPYDNTCDGSPSGNGNGNGQATGKPCAGCVGNADDKNPKGQMPNGSDHNAGYECDRNHGIGRTNPAHTGCKTTTVTPPPTGCANPPCNPGGGNPGGGNPGGGNPGGGNPGGGNPTPPGQQTVLGTTQTGSAPAPAAPQSTPAPRSEVLGESEEGSAPASSTAPAETAPTSALRTRAAPASGSLPFTGGDAVIVLLAGCMMLLTGFGLQRLLTRS
jgi:hypothetical protein